MFSLFSCLVPVLFAKTMAVVSRRMYSILAFICAVLLVGYAGTAQQPGSSAVTTACSATSPDGVLGSVHTPQPTDDPMASPVLDDSVIGQPGRTPASTSPHRVDYNQSPASHCTVSS